MKIFKKIYVHIPEYGQIILRKGNLLSRWFKNSESETYYSLMLKGARKHWFGSNTFYLSFTEHCLKEAISRGEINMQYMKNPVPFGKYTGIQHIENAGRAKNTFDCIFLNVYRYTRGGAIEDKIIAMSERQFRRAIARGRAHPELLVKRRFWHGVYKWIFEKLLFFAET